MGIAHGQVARIEDATLAEQIAVAVRVVGHPVVPELSIVEVVPRCQPIRRNEGLALIVDEPVGAKERGLRARVGPVLEVEAELDDMVRSESRAGGVVAFIVDGELLRQIT